ncbi:putative HTH-type transcriptional regulator YybA [Propionigenium maris DSM 9537]|uniref:HTH-type transcriptional regulator YybA n=1 Tax=Propionigenium maris DSM 9537 TaxID=1123000 RepID=A0A9W6GMR2_9FUSO|nr:MarR family transcriptional regulator [Propionigenium maris]GLI57157.1 putative HTH-type transcriptional regulator YybA [Propionigenium maris DSM 9537]
MKEILREIGMIGRCCATISDIEFKEINLAKGQYLYLVRIYENPGIIQERVAAMLKVDRSTAAKAIKKLVEGGLVERVKEEGNKKELKLYCTPKGRKIYPFLEREEEHSVRVATEGMTQKEMRLAFDLLHRIRKNIEREWEDIKKGNPRRY